MERDYAKKQYKALIYITADSVSPLLPRMTESLRGRNFYWVPWENLHPVLASHREKAPELIAAIVNDLMGIMTGREPVPFSGFNSVGPYLARDIFFWRESSLMFSEYVYQKCGEDHIFWFE